IFLNGSGGLEGQFCFLGWGTPDCWGTSSLAPGWQAASAGRASALPSLPCGLPAAPAGVVEEGGAAAAPPAAGRPDPAAGGPGRGAGQGGGRRAGGGVLAPQGQPVGPAHAGRLELLGGAVQPQRRRAPGAG